MPLIETEAVILRTYRLAEADKIVVTMTRDAGLLRCTARGARRLKSRFGAALEPWTICDITYFEKEGRELISLKSAEIVSTFFESARDPDKVHALAYMSELAIEFMPPHEVNANMYRMMKACSEAAQMENVNIRRLTQYFEVWTLRLSGFMPSLRACMKCRNALSPQSPAHINLDTGVRCAQCAGGADFHLSTQSAGIIRKIQTVSPSQYATQHSGFDKESEHEVNLLMRRLIVRALEREPRGRLSQTA